MARQFLVTEAQAVHDAGPEILDDDVGLAAEAQRHGAALGGFRIKDDGTLVAVDGIEAHALALVERWTLVAHRITVG